MLKSELRKLSLTPPSLEVTDHLIAWDAAALEVSTPFEIQELSTELGSLTIQNDQRSVKKQVVWSGSALFRLRGILPRSSQRWIVATPTFERSTDNAQALPYVELHLLATTAQEPLITLRFTEVKLTVTNHVANVVKEFDPGGVMLSFNSTTNTVRLYRSSQFYSATVSVNGAGVGGATLIGEIGGGSGSKAKLQFSSGVRPPTYSEPPSGSMPLMFVEARLPTGAVESSDLLATSDSYRNGIRIRKGERYRVVGDAVVALPNVTYTARTDRQTRFTQPISVQKGTLQFTDNNLLLEPDRETVPTPGNMVSVINLGRGIRSVYSAIRAVVLGTALPLATRLNRVVAIGTLAERAIEAYNSVLIGENSANRALAITGATVVGDGAASQITQRLEQTTAVGYRALGSSGGDQRVLRSVVAVGPYSLYGSVTGDRNTALGAFTGFSEQTFEMQDTVAVGYRSLAYRTGAVGRSVALGVNSGYGMMGEGVVAIGHNAGLESQGLQTNTIYIGREAGMYAPAFINAAAFGYRAVPTANHHIQLGNVDQWVVTSNGYQTRMDARDMADVRPTVFGLDFIKRLKPVDYRNDSRERYIDYSSRPSPPTPPTVSPDDPLYAQQQAEYSTQLASYNTELRRWLLRNGMNDIVATGANTQGGYRHGFKAQEVNEAALQSGAQFGGLVNHATYGGPNVLALSMDDFIPPIVKAIQELANQVNGDALANDVANRVVTMLNSGVNSPLVDAVAERVLQQLLTRR